jgi:hypothetical protein
VSRFGFVVEMRDDFDIIVWDSGFVDQASVPVTVLWERVAELEEAVRDVMQWRVGNLPTLGYVDDNDKSREALEALAELMEGH